MLCDFSGRGGFAEAGNVGVLRSCIFWQLNFRLCRFPPPNRVVAPPLMVGPDNLLNVLLGEFTVNAVDKRAHLAGVDEERFTAAVAEAIGDAAVGVGDFAGGLAAGEEPEADGDLGAIEELAGEGDHAVDEVGFDEGFADLAFAGLIRGHAAIGEDEAGHAMRGEVVDEVLNPGEVGIALRRDAVLPADVVVLAVPVGVVEGRVGEDVVGAEIGVDVAAEGVGLLGPEVGLEAAQGEIHDGQAAGGGVALLAINRDVAELAAVGFDEFLGLHEHAPGAAAGVVDAALVRREHADEEADDAARGVELAAILPLGAGELGQKVFIDPAENVLGAVFPVAEADRADEVDEFAEAMFIEGGAGVVLGEDAFEARIVALEGNHGVVDDLADGGLLGLGLEVGPAGFLGHPEDVFGLVLVLILGIGAGVIALPGGEAGVVFLEAIGDVFEEDEAEDDVLVLRRVHVVAELVGGEPELGFEAKGVGTVFGRGGTGARHCGGGMCALTNAGSTANTSPAVCLARVGWWQRWGWGGEENCGGQANAGTVFARFTDGLENFVAALEDRAFLRAAVVSRFFPHERARFRGFYIATA